jgi:hypothetical protein
MAVPVHPGPLVFFLLLAALLAADAVLQAVHSLAAPLFFHSHSEKSSSSFDSPQPRHTRGRIFLRAARAADAVLRAVLHAVHSLLEPLAHSHSEKSPSSFDSPQPPHTRAAMQSGHFADVQPPHTRVAMQSVHHGTLRVLFFHCA